MESYYVPIWVRVEAKNKQTAENAVDCIVSPLLKDSTVAGYRVNRPMTENEFNQQDVLY